ncbi:MAG: formylglycine-generating enzyme family protein [Calditrichaeota bacterium]|nr:formylglycine-generating enzyme family protein [Calditrichota bacterium]
MKRLAGDVAVQVTATKPKQGEKSAGPLPGMNFVLIPGGSFMMGSNDGYENEKPVHRVEIKSFYMMTTEVTQAQWRTVMGDNPSCFKGDDLPVEYVSWSDCQEFIKKLNQRDPGKGYRLPSEAEWEYACRAGTTTKYYTGDSESDLARAGWYYGNSDSKTHPVGQKQPNAWGLYDMHGNVWEWCEDWYHDTYNGAPGDGRAWTSPAGTYRVLRGGSWIDGGRYCRGAFRGRFGPDSHDGLNGFRVVCSS